MFFLYKMEHHSLYKASLCPKSSLHSQKAFEDVFLPDEVETYNETNIHIAQKVTELIGEELVKQGGLE